MAQHNGRPARVDQGAAPPAQRPARDEGQHRGEAEVREPGRGHLGGVVGMGVVMILCCLGVAVILGLTPIITLPGALAMIVLWLAAMTGVHWLVMDRSGHNHGG